MKSQFQSVSTVGATALIVCLLPLQGTAAELSPAELCKLLTAEEVTQVLGAKRTAAPDGTSGCIYENPSIPAIHLMNASSETREEYVESVTGLKGKVTDGPDGAVLSSVGFDLQKGKTSEIWFKIKDSPVQLLFDAGMEPEKALALLKAARN